MTRRFTGPAVACDHPPSCLTDDLSTILSNADRDLAVLANGGRPLKEDSASEEAMFKTFVRSTIAAGFVLALGLGADIAAADDNAAWDGIRNDLYGTRTLEDGAGKIGL